MPTQALIFLGVVAAGLTLLVVGLVKTHGRSSDDGAEGRRSTQWDVPGSSSDSHHGDGGAHH